MSLMDEINNQMNINAQKEREAKQRQDLKIYLDPRGIMHTDYEDETFINTASVNTQTPNGVGDLIKEALGILKKSRFTSDIQYSSEKIQMGSVAVTYVWSCHFQTEENGKRGMVEDFRHYIVFYSDFKDKIFNSSNKQAVEYLDSYMTKYCSHVSDSKYTNRFVAGSGIYLFEDGYCFDASRYDGCIRDLTSGYGDKGFQFNCFKQKLAALVIANK